MKYIVFFEDIREEDLPSIGRKGFNLGKLYRSGDFSVPRGFSIRSSAYREIVDDNPEVRFLISKLEDLADNRELLRLGERIMDLFSKLDLPQDFRLELDQALGRLDADSFAIRSSPIFQGDRELSFAGQQDSYLNIKSLDKVCHYVLRTMASVFSPRALVYRKEMGLEFMDIESSIIVQEMVDSDYSGVMFTADPLSHNRNIVSIDLAYGLGKYMTSGRVSSSNYRVENGQVLENLQEQSLKLVAQEGLGLDEEKYGQEPRLDRDTVLRLAGIGRAVEKLLAYPQDIEWAIKDGHVYILQSRDICKLFPVPDSEEERLYLSIAHTHSGMDLVKPLGISFLGRLSDYPVVDLASRPYLDFTDSLARPEEALADFSLGLVDKDMLNSLDLVLEDQAYMEELARPEWPARSKASGLKTKLTSLILRLTKKSLDLEEIQQEFDEIVQDLKNELGQAPVGSLVGDIKLSRDYLEEIRTNDELVSLLARARESRKKLDQLILDRMDQDRVSHTLEGYRLDQGFYLDLTKLSDIVRDCPQVIDFFQEDYRKLPKEAFYSELGKLPAGNIVSNEIKKFVKKFYYRADGELDISRPRFMEDPRSLVPSILRHMIFFNMESFKANERAKDKKSQALRKEILEAIPDQAQNIESYLDDLDQAQEVQALLDDYSLKFMAIYRLQLGRLADELTRLDLLESREDIYYLYLDEIGQALESKSLEPGLVARRKKDFAGNQELEFPRIISSSGKTPEPEAEARGPLRGLGVSPGIVEGVATVITTFEEAKAFDGEILVTNFTDPNWSPLFPQLKGLITEVGSSMNHNAKLAREYKLPAVLAADGAKEKIKTGDIVRIDGRTGQIDILVNEDSLFLGSR